MSVTKPTKGQYNWDVTLNTALDYLDNRTSRVVSVPETASSTGAVGQIAYNSTHLFVCVGTNTWVKVAREEF